MDRREFLTATGTTVATMTAAQYSRVLGANDRLNTAVVGVNGRGKSHIRAVAANAGMNVGAVVDIDQSVAEKAVAYTKQYQQDAPKEYRDLRDMLADKEIDVVTIATTNHWHALSTIWAVQAGKDVYCEKPASHNIWEGRKMVEAARKYKRIVQVGQQSRSTPFKIEAIQRLREGVIGEVYMAKGLCFKRRKSIGSTAVSAVPPGVDYDIWLGPAQPHEFKQNRFHYNWHWHWAFGNGDIGNQGVHEMDVARWGLGIDHLPEHVFSAGGHFVYDDDQETPNTQHATFDYGGRMLQFEVRGLITGGECRLLEDSGGGNHTIGVLFFGSDGFLTISGRGYQTYLGEKRTPGPHRQSEGDSTALHFENFRKAALSRRVSDLNCDVLEGHLSAALCHLANISYRTGDKLLFDAETERFVGNFGANTLLKRDYRAPWIVPEEV
ncbi:MAG: Gfo/Idh/MocA family oxidoreductase [Bryobacterales bacterium]|nr:Gfo/Idh/MocA family oxidoreductase [Bryobacterales bacterium]